MRDDGRSSLSDTSGGDRCSRSGGGTGAGSSDSSDSGTGSGGSSNGVPRSI